MATWAALEAEIDLWHQAGEQPTFWWRDDDTTAPTDALRTLTVMTAQHGIPLHLAVIPHGIAPELKPFLDAAPHVLTLQHGLAHVNHEPKSMPASEIGQTRPLEATQTDLKNGWKRLADAALPNLLPVLTPPWNRVGDKVVPHLAQWGYHALSCFYARPRRVSVGGLRHINTHIDPLRWRPQSVFAGEGKTLAQCIEHLQARRTGLADKDEPTGLLTHHLQTPLKAWEFCDALAARLTFRDRVRWITLASHLEGA